MSVINSLPPIALHMWVVWGKWVVFITEFNLFMNEGNSYINCEVFHSSVLNNSAYKSTTYVFDVY
jgi:hypothetical protein